MVSCCLRSQGKSEPGESEPDRALPILQSGACDGIELFENQLVLRTSGLSQ
jgi:hypothetical protein